MTHTPQSFVARIVLGAVALACVAAAVPASAHPYDGRDWHRDRWAERGYYEGYRHDWRPVVVEAPGYNEGYRPDWSPDWHYDRGPGHVVYEHGPYRRW